MSKSYAFTVILFQSTLPRRERRPAFMPSGTTLDFNPRSREGSDGSCPLLSGHLCHFNPRSREGSDECTIVACIRSTEFQSTLPRRERRREERKSSPLLPYFNPRSREGSDRVSAIRQTGIYYFNPRSREGSD